MPIEQKYKTKVIAIVGPTATGKSRLAHEFAKYIPSEIISADSRLIYKKMNIGTAKPSLKEREERIYHLIDIIEPNQDFSLANYLEIAQPLLKSILNKDKFAIIVGGTGFYLRGLLENLHLHAVKPDFNFREEIKNIETSQLYAKLKAKDINNIYKMHFNDRPRIIRALEIEKADCKNESKLSENDFEIIWIGMNYLERAFLREQIKKRTNQMLKDGLVEETQNLINEYGELEIFQKTIGYQQVLQYFKDNNLDLLADLINISTNQYAKRQMTWFRANKNINWFNAEEDLPLLIEKAKMLVLKKNW